MAITEIIDRMVANGTLVQDSVFSAEFAAKYADKLVGVPGPVWYTGAIFQDGLNVPAGEIGVSAPLYWEGGDVAAGNVGGGVWYASSHSKNLDAVKTFLEFVTSSDEFQVELSSGYPAYARRPRAGSPSRPRAATSSRRLRADHDRRRRLRCGTAGASRA